MPNKLFLLPTPDTRSYLETIFRDLPFRMNYEGLCVEIGSSLSPIVPSIGAVYRALPGALGIWYETATARSWILLPLVPSPEMCARHTEVGDAWQRTFIPYMALTSEFNNTSKMKPRLNSIATGLVDRRPELFFSCETVLTDEAVVPSQADFYEDYTKNGIPPIYQMGYGGA